MMKKMAMKSENFELNLRNFPFGFSIFGSWINENDSSKKIVKMLAILWQLFVKRSKISVVLGWTCLYILCLATVYNLCINKIYCWRQTIWVTGFPEAWIITVLQCKRKYEITTMKSCLHSAWNLNKTYVSGTSMCNWHFKKELFLKARKLNSKFLNWVNS